MKIVCYNLDQRMQYPEYAKLIVELLLKFRADVFILQEIMRWQDVETLALALGMHCDKGAFCAGGHTVITRTAIQQTWRALVPKSTWKNGITGVKIRDPSGSLVWIFSTHLDDMKYKKDETLRLHETEYILSHLPPFQRAIIGGDFNSNSHLDNKSDHGRILPSNLFEKAGWRDVQAGHEWTRSTWMPSKSAGIDRIDRIYTKGRLRSIRGGIVDHKDVSLAKWPTGQDHRLLWHVVEFM